MGRRREGKYTSQKKFYGGFSGKLRKRSPSS
jgi:hypothetical protein